MYTDLHGWWHVEQPWINGHTMQQFTSVQTSSQGSAKISHIHMLTIKFKPRDTIFGIVMFLIFGYVWVIV